MKGASDLKAWAKRSAKLALRHAGVEAHSYIPGASREAQLYAALEHFHIAHVLDIGANTGQFGRELLDNGFRGRIISVEPLFEAHARLTVAARQAKNWTVHDATAVGAKAGMLTFHVAANSVSSSAFEVLDASVKAAPQSRQIEQRVVPVITVDELARSYALPAHGCLLKVDTQGYEWPVLDGASETLQHFELVLLELSLSGLYAGQRLWLDVIDRMARAGFGVWAFQPEFIDPATGQTLQVNGLFHRLAQTAGPAGGMPAGAS